ncbi:MAG TPA: CHAT domain-containing protein [Nocardioides sp.]|nr:CHAT domain-containing protein [Nocardioides sp.]
MPSRRYLDFDLLLEQQADGEYQAVVTGSPLGETTSEHFRLPFDAQTLEILLLKLDPGRSGTRRVGASSQQQAAMDFGGPLFEAIFRDDLALAWTRSQDLARHQDAGLRLRLRLSGAPAIAGLPWELLYDRKTNAFLAQSERTPLVRYLDVPQVPRPLVVDGPLRVLAIISSPSDLEVLDVDGEWRLLQGALAPRIDAGLVVLDRLPRPELSELGPWLRRQQTHIIHFIGHGDFDDRLREGVVYFQDKLGGRTAVTSSVLGPYLRDHDPLRMVVLNACRSARTDAVDPFGGMAQGLVQQDATAVVAMQFPISDRAAVTFTSDFYGSLADGLPVDQAVTSARKALLAEFRDEWATPVLFMRAPDGHIFENVAPEPASSGDVPEPLRRSGPESPVPMTPGWITRHRRLLTAAAGAAVVALSATLFVIARGDDRGPGQTTPDAPAAETSAAGRPAETDQTDAPTGTPTGEGDALVGAWTGTASYGKGDRFDVQLDIVGPCRLQEPCGTIYVSSTPCTGQVTLWTVVDGKYEFYVDDFTGDSTSGCHPGPGEFFEIIDEGTLRYTTDYSVAGVLHKTS